MKSVIKVADRKHKPRIAKHNPAHPNYANYIPSFGSSQAD